jgi:plastocyanin
MNASVHRRDVLRFGGSAVAAGVAGCLGGEASEERTVSMTDKLTFEPKTVTVRTGGTVTWKNDSGVGHTVTAYEDVIPEGASYFASGGFESESTARNRTSDGLIAAGESYEHTFEVAGTYEYYCIPHESGGMVGTVEVE